MPVAYRSIEEPAAFKTKSNRLISTDGRNTELVSVLTDVYELLEAYSPVWYPARLRNRIKRNLEAPD